MTMFGMGEGFRTYRKDRAELAEMAARKALIEAQTVTEQNRPALQEREMTLQEAQEKSIARFREAQASQMEAKVAEDARLLAALREGAQPSGENAPQTAEQAYASMTAQADAYTRAGRPDKAAEIVAQMSLVRQREQSAAASAQTAKASQIQKQMQMYETVKDIFGAVKDPLSHAEAVMAYDSLPFAKEFPLDPRIRDNYNPTAIAALTAGAKKMEADAKAQLERDKFESLEDSRKATAEYRKLRAGQIERQIEQRDLLAARKAKVGGGEPGKPVRGPAKTQVDQAIVELKRLKLDPSNAEERSAMGRMIASEALTLQNTHPTLSYEEALAKAIDGAKERRDVEPKTLMGFETGGRKFDPKFGSASRPLDATSLKSPADLKPNMYIRGADGSVKYWDGKTLTAIKPAASRPPAVGGVFDDEEDDE